MRKAKYIFLSLLSIGIVLVIVMYAFLNKTRPLYNGMILLKGIESKTTVYFDDYGVPHIYANNQKDAMVALGYVHAQDRLWQMELMRRIAPGRLSEIFGNPALKTDLFFSGIGIDENSTIAVAQMDENSQTYILASAYLQGINNYLAQGKTPVEFSLLGIKKEKFTLKDVYNIFGFMSFSFAMAQKTDPILTDIRDRLGPHYLDDFGIHGEFNTKQLKSYKGNLKVYSQISKSISALLENTVAPPFIGSNSWVIGGEKTKSGKVILANDPHIMYSQPGTWYEAHISCPNYEMYGFYIAGTPFPLLGHNRTYAYGLTMFENDDVDFFQETENPTNSKQYKTKDGFKNYEFQQKTIRVKDSTSVKLMVKTSQHGTVINGLLEGVNGKNPVAMSWIYIQQKNQILQAVYKLSHAKDLNDFHKNIALIHAPGLNIMYGDALGNVAWITSGKLYKVPKSVNTNFILNGSNGIDDQKTFLPFEQNPSAINPPWHYVYSSNNQPEAVNGYLYPGYYLPKDRALRIDGLLQSKKDWTKESVSKMLVDNRSTVIPQVVSKMTNVLDTSDFNSQEIKALQFIKQWNGSHALSDVAPTIYNKWLYFYLKDTYEDELGEENFKLFLGTHIVKQLIENQTKNGNSPWWDNRTTTQKKETQSQILTKSFKEAVQSLEKQIGSDMSQWSWGKVHQVTFQHPIGKVKLFEKFFNVGPYPIEGSNEVINNQLFTYSDDAEIAIKGGPSTRRVVDFSDIENCWSILPTGQSGNPMSPHYKDQNKLFVNGGFRKMMLNKKEIIATSSKLVFNPKKE